MTTLASCAPSSYNRHTQGRDGGALSYASPWCRLWGKSCSGSTLNGPGTCRSHEQSRRVVDYLQANCFAPGQGVASVE